MNIVWKCALVGASLIVAYACANPVAIDDDVLLANPNDFGDGGILPGTGGTTGVGTGGTGSGVGGSAGSSAGAGGTVSNVGGTGAGVGGTGASVGGTSSGTGGTGAGVGGTGTGGTGAGTGGTGTGGTGAGTGGTGAGTGGTGSAAVFDPNSCSFTNTTGCDDLACAEVCPTNDGNSCLNRCNAVITCVTDNSDCISEADPLCGDRITGQPKDCTTVVEPAGGFNPSDTNQPSFVARQFVECLCSTPRP